MVVLVLLFVEVFDLLHLIVLKLVYFAVGEETWKRQVLLFAALVLQRFKKIDAGVEAGKQVELFEEQHWEGSLADLQNKPLTLLVDQNWILQEHQSAEFAAVVRNVKFVVCEHNGGVASAHCDVTDPDVAVYIAPDAHTLLVVHGYDEQTLALGFVFDESLQQYEWTLGPLDVY